jgi:hypothetical protein
MGRAIHLLDDIELTDLLKDGDSPFYPYQFTFTAFWHISIRLVKNVFQSYYFTPLTETIHFLYAISIAFSASLARKHIINYLMKIKSISNTICLYFHHERESYLC